MGFTEIFDLKPPSGKIALTWFNSYSGIAVRTPGATVIFDPVKINLEECIQADGIVITHEHVDHFEPELVRELQRRTGAVVLTTPFLAQRLDLDNAKALRVGDSLVIKGIQICAERCEHPGNQPLSFIIAAEGVTLYHPSDSAAFPEMIEIRDKYEPDILLYWGTSSENGVEIARLIRPRIILTYDGPVGSSAKLVDLAKRELPATRIQTIKRFEIYQYP